jgi:hypothetical protein
MAEKFSCPACSRKYSLEKNRVCPACGLSPSDAEFYSGSPSKSSSSAKFAGAKFEPYTGLEAQDLRDDVNRLSSAVSALATGLFAMMLLTIAGAALIGAGTAQAVTCAFDGETCGSAVIFWGQVCLAVGALFGIISSITALSKSSLR